MSDSPSKSIWDDKKQNNLMLEIINEGSINSLYPSKKSKNIFENLNDTFSS
jgi:hypothetical protein